VRSTKRIPINHRRRKTVASVAESVDITLQDTVGFRKIARAKINKTLLEILDVLLFVFKMSTKYVAFLVGEWLIVQAIHWTAGDFPPDSFEGIWLKNISILSNIGAFVAYVIHFVKSFNYEFRDLREPPHTRDMREPSYTKETA
jgi:hypothetical protein